MMNGIGKEDLMKINQIREKLWREKLSEKGKKGENERDKNDITA